MTSRNAEPVKCTCGWRGRRVWRECWCEDYCSCSRYGECPRCGLRVETVATLRERARQDREAEAFFASPEGQVVLRKEPS